jgi:hypothetical protein
MQLGCVCGRASGIVVGVSLDAARAAFQRFAAALDQPRDPALLRAAVSDDIALDRHAPGERGVAPLVESLTGIAAVAQWLARTPPTVRFGLAGDVSPAPAGSGGGAADADRWAIEYAYDAGDFHNGGIWIARLAPDGRIAHLSHHPFALREAPGTPHAHGGSGHTHGG